MHLGIKNLIGGAKKYLFGDGAYSQNIVQEIDLAPTATLSTVGTIAPSYPVSQIVDGSNTTAGGLNSQTADTRIIFDYGTAKRFRRVVTSVNISNVTTGARLSYSDNGSDWTPVVDITTPVSAGYTNTDFADVGRIAIRSLSWVSGYLFYTTVKMSEQVLQPQDYPLLQAVPQGEGTAVGNLNTYGSMSLNTAFNGVREAQGATSAISVSINGWGNRIGKTWAAPKVITKAEVWAPTNAGFIGASPQTYGMRLLGSNDGGATFDVLWSSTGRAGVSAETVTITGLPEVAYTTHIIDLYGNGAQTGAVSELWFTEKVGVLEDCIVITGAATVAPDAETGAAVYTAKNIVALPGGSLAPSTNCKGLIGLVSESVRLIGGGVIHIDKLGKAGNFGNLTVLDLMPQSIKRRLKGDLAAFVVQGEGAAGVAASTGALQVKVGAAAGGMQTGSGGEGRTGYGASAAQGYTTGKGGPCCGGAGTAADCYTSSGVLAAGALAAGPYGGPGGKTGTTKQYTSGSTGGGAGDPVGAGSTDGNPGTGAGGGLLMLLTPTLSIASGCRVSADGAAGGAASNMGGGGAGGGCVVVVTPAGGYANAGTVRASGGAGGAATYAGGAGGVGSVNILTV